MNRAGAIAVGGLLVAACTFRGMPGLEAGSSTDTPAGDDAEEVVPPVAEARGGGSASTMADGVAGSVCSEEGASWIRKEYGYTGPCWDPPGNRMAAYMPSAAIRGRRAVEQTSTDTTTKVWWFNMPEGQLDATSNCPSLQGSKADFWAVYEPYQEDGGFAPFVVEGFVGLKLDQALDQLDALDQPVCVTVRTDPQCDDGHGKVCTQSLAAGEPIGDRADLTLVVGSDIKDEGTPDEERRFPEVVNRKLDEVVADLKARGFTNVKVVEDSVQCERGIVCESDPGLGAEWVGTDEEIRLIVRRAKQT